MDNRNQWQLNSSQSIPKRGRNDVKKLIKSCLIVAGLCVAMIQTAQADPFVWYLDPDSGTTILGAATTSQVLVSPTFIAPYGPAFAAIVVRDTAAGNGALTDSFALVLQKGVDLMGTNGAYVVDTNNVWITVATLPAFDPTKNVGKKEFFSADSVSLGAYEVGGTMRFLLIKGGGQSADTVNGNYSLRAFFEAKGME